MGIIQKKGLYLFEEFLDLGVYAGFTGREFSGKNMSEDLERVSFLLGISFGRIVYLNQVHGSRVVFPSKDRGSVYTGDALLSREKGVILSIRTADCMPVSFYDEETRSLGMIHLGWRPAKEGILDNFVDEFVKISGNDFYGEALLGIGPALRKCCFEVGEEFLEYPSFSPIIEERDGKYFLDMVGFLERRLSKRGIKYNLLDSGICGKCRKDFYSYRRERTDKRTVSFMVRK